MAILCFFFRSGESPGISLVKCKLGTSIHPGSRPRLALNTKNWDI